VGVERVIASAEHVVIEARRSKIVGCVLILSGMLLCAYWLFHRPAPGLSVAFMGAAVAVMSLRVYVKGLETAGWLVLIFAFLVVEILAIRKDRFDNQQQQATLRMQEAANFSSIGEGIRSAIQQSQEQFQATMSGTKTLINKSTNLERVSKIGSASHQVLMCEAG
jgi:hypothetical protein